MPAKERGEKKESSAQECPPGFTLRHTLRGHTDVICRLAWSPDGCTLASPSIDATVRLWDVTTGEAQRVLEGDIKFSLGVAWSPDGRIFASPSWGGGVRLWDAGTGEMRGKLAGYGTGISCVAWSPDGRILGSGSDEGTILLWDAAMSEFGGVLEGHNGPLYAVAWSPDGRTLASASEDTTVRLWDAATGELRVTLEGHSESVISVSWSPDGQTIASASSDRTVRLWDTNRERAVAVFEGHTNSVTSVSFSCDGKLLASYASGHTHLLRCDTWETVTAFQDGKGSHLVVPPPSLAFHPTAPVLATLGEGETVVRIWDLDLDVLLGAGAAAAVPSAQYTNAKVLLVGDTSSGKTGLAHRLATGKWKPSDGSTVGAWATQWKLEDGGADGGVKREVWLWDFGGQADQRLVHQLYMDRAALILLLFNADDEDVLPGLRDWQAALQRSVPRDTPQFLVAGRIDAGFRASRAKLQGFAEEQGLAYHETSALDGTGCEALRAALMAGIPWDRLETRTSPEAFKLGKDAILALRDKGEVLHTFKELRALVLGRIPAESGFSDAILRTVIGLLDGPGAVKELDYGTYVLLQPEWVNAYAQAVIRTLRSDDSELGCLPLRSIAEGKLIYQSVERDGKLRDMKRLPPAEERIVLAEMERQLMERGLCLRQGDKLVFPGHCGRDRLPVPKYPSIFISYDVKGYLDDLYATLVVKLADSDAFALEELWRDAADFTTLEGGHRMGIKLRRDAAGHGNVSVYFGPGVTRQEQVIFANYIHAHLEEGAEEVRRLRHYVCPKCGTAKGNPQVLMDKLIRLREKADTECDGCEERFPLWDALEKKFAGTKVRAAVENLQAEDAVRLDARRKGKLLVLEAGARITRANQKWYEIPQEEDEGIDVEMEFTDDEGKGTGTRIYLQLKAGNSHLRKRKKDGVEVFAIKKQRWVDYWLKQPGPVMLVIGTFPEDERELGGREKLRFADVRWMEIKDYLKKKSANGKKQVRSIEFKGERLDVASIRRWRDKVRRQRQP